MRRAAVANLAVAVALAALTIAILVLRHQNAGQVGHMVAETIEDISTGIATLVEAAHHTVCDEQAALALIATILALGRDSINHVAASVTGIDTGVFPFDDLLGDLVQVLNKHRLAKQKKYIARSIPRHIADVLVIIVLQFKKNKCSVISGFTIKLYKNVINLQ